MKDWHGTSYDAIGDHMAREAISTINDFLFQLSPSIGRITRSQTPNSSGGGLGGGGLATDDFLFKPGILAGQLAHGGTAAGDNLTFRSTVHDTKGFIYFAGEDGLAYDETNTRVGLNVPAPEAKIHMEVAAPVGQTPSVTDCTLFTGINFSPSSGTLLSAVGDTDSADWARYTELGSSASIKVEFAAISDPLVTSGFSLTISMRSSASVGNRGFAITLFNSIDNSAILDSGTTWLVGGDGATVGPWDTTCTTSFGDLTRTLTASEAGRILYSNSHIYAIISFQGVVTNSGTTLDVGYAVFEAPPVGGGSAETLQTWQTPSYDNSLDFGDDGTGSGTLDLILSGDAPLRISSGGGTSGLRLLTSSTNGRIEAGTAAQANMNLVLSGARDATATLITSKATKHTFTGVVQIEGGSPAVGDILSATNTSGLADWVTFASLLDDDLEAIAALSDSATGLLAKTAANTWALRTLSAPAAFLTIANPAGIAGNPTFAFSGISGGVPYFDSTTTVASSAVLAANQIVLGGGAGATPATLGSLGTTTTVLHGNAAGAPTFGAVALASDVSGDLPFANLTQIAGLSVLGVTGSSTADVAAITAGTDNQVLRRSGTALTFGAVNLASTDAVTGDLPFSNLAQGSALSVLGVTGNATADNASIAAASDHQVMRRSGTAVAFGAVNLASTNAVTGVLPAANLGTHDHSGSTQGGATLNVPDATFTITDNADPTKKLQFQAGAISTGTTRTLEAPDVDGVVCPVASVGAFIEFSLLAGPGVLPRFTDNFAMTDGSSGFNSFWFCPTLSNTATNYVPRGAAGTMVVYNHNIGAGGTGTAGDQPDAGALLYGNSTTTAMRRLSIGASGTILTSSGSAPQWSTNASVVDQIRTWSTTQKFPDNTFQIVGSANAAKIAQFEVDGLSVGTRTYTLQDASVTIPGLNMSDQSWTGANRVNAESGGYFDIRQNRASSNVGFLFTDLNSTFASNFKLLSTGLTTDQVLSIPDVTGTLAVIDAAQTWTALQTFRDTTFKIVDDSDSTKTLVFSLGGNSASADGTIATVFTTDKTVTIPDIAGTLMSLAGSQTVTGQKTFDCTDGSTAPLFSSSAPEAGFLTVVDQNTTESLVLQTDGAISASNSLVFPVAGGTVLTNGNTVTVSNKTFSVTGNTLRASTASSGAAFEDNTTNSKKLRMVLSNVAASTNNSMVFRTSAARTWTFENSDGTVLTDAGTMFYDDEIVAIDGEALVI